MFLHEDRELFKEVIDAVSEHMSVSRETVEKDYYVTIGQGKKKHDDTNAV